MCTRLLAPAHERGKQTVNVIYFEVRRIGAMKMTEILKRASRSENRASCEVSARSPIV